MPDPWNKCPYFLKFFFQLRFSRYHSPKTGILFQFYFHIILDQNYLLYELYWKYAHYPQNIKAMLSIPRKLVLPTGNLKQNFWGNEFSISGTKGTHVSVSGTCSRFWKRKDLQIREHLIRIFLDSGTWFPKLKLRFQNQEHLQKSGA